MVASFSPVPLFASRLLKCFSYSVLQLVAKFKCPDYRSRVRNIRRRVSHTGVASESRLPVVPTKPFRRAPEDMHRQADDRHRPDTPRS